MFFVSLENVILKVHSVSGSVLVICECVTKVSRFQQLRTIINIFVPVSIGQEFGSRLAVWLWLGVSREVIPRRQSELQSSGSLKKAGDRGPLEWLASQCSRSPALVKKPVEMVVNLRLRWAWWVLITPQD